jgi:WD40 repeat protein
LRHTRRCYRVSFSADGRWVATSSKDGTARVWDTSSGRQEGEALEHPDTVFRARFSRDGERLLTACRDGAARLWDWRRGTLLCPPLSHRPREEVPGAHSRIEVLDASFVPGTPWVATVSLDETLRLWECATAQPIAPPLSLSGSGWSLDITPDGRFAIVAGSGSTIDVAPLTAVTSGSREQPRLDRLCLWFELVSGHRLHQGGKLARLGPGDWRARWQDFRSSAVRYTPSAP